jgi:hypothetical protein
VAWHYHAKQGKPLLKEVLKTRACKYGSAQITWLLEKKVKKRRETGPLKIKSSRKTQE